MLVHRELRSVLRLRYTMHQDAQMLQLPIGIGLGYDPCRLLAEVRHLRHSTTPQTLTSRKIAVVSTA